MSDDSTAVEHAASVKQTSGASARRIVSGRRLAKRNGPAGLVNRGPFTR